MIEASSTPSEGRRKEMVGRVVSNKMQNTVVVAVAKVRHHRLYKRAVRLTKKYYAHDEADNLLVGDVVRIVETRPLSRLKRWRVAEVLRHGQGAPVDVEDVPALEESPPPPTTAEPRRVRAAAQASRPAEPEVEAEESDEEPAP